MGTYDIKAKLPTFICVFYLIQNENLATLK